MTQVHMKKLPDTKSPSVYQEVHNERERAHAKHGAAGNSREDQPWDNPEWLPILVEEVGEAAHHLTYDAQDIILLRKELVQVAAMACAWIDSIDRQYEQWGEQRAVDMR